MINDAFLAQDTYYFEKLGLQNQAEIWEDGLRTNGSKGTYEWWYFDAEYTNGFKVVVIFYSKNRFDVNGPTSPVATIDIIFPNGTSINKIILDDTNVIKASKEKCDVKICDSIIRYENGNYYIDFISSEIEYHCIMEPTFPMWRPETGHVYFGEPANKFWAWLVAVPSAICTATLNINSSLISMTGSGYHDHNWGNCEMNSIINNWYWCRTNINDYIIISCDIIAEKRYNNTRIPLVLISNNNEEVTCENNYTVIERLAPSIHPLTNKFIHNNLTLSKDFKNSNIKIEFLRDHDILATNLLDAFGYSRIKIIICSLMKKIPTYLRSVGIVKLTVTKNNKEETFEKEGIWEQMYFGN